MPFNCSRFLAAFYGYLSPLSCSFNRTRVLQRLLLITATNRLHLLTQPANVAYTSWAKNLLLVLLSVFAMIRTITNGRRRHQQPTTNNNNSDDDGSRCAFCFLIFFVWFAHVFSFDLPNWLSLFVGFVSSPVSHRFAFLLFIFCNYYNYCLLGFWCCFCFADRIVH